MSQITDTLSQKAMRVLQGDRKATRPLVPPHSERQANGQKTSVRKKPYNSKKRGGQEQYPNHRVLMTLVRQRRTRVRGK